jgi:hypothetical protein
MTENINRISLCSNCKNAPTCTFPKDPNRPSFYCEEFEIEELPQKKITRIPPIDSHLTKEKDAVGFKGLCSDCENRRTCKFPKPEGGVWHCEEYQ